MHQLLDAFYFSNEIKEKCNSLFWLCLDANLFNLFSTVAASMPAKMSAKYNFES
jgi:hypothetical protein